MQKIVIRPAVPAACALFVAPLGHRDPQPVAAYLRGLGPILVTPTDAILPAS